MQKAQKSKVASASVLGLHIVRLWHSQKGQEFPLLLTPCLIKISQPGALTRAANICVSHQPRPKEKNTQNSKKEQKKKVSKENLRKHHRLAIQRPSISPNALPPKHALDVNPPRFVETNSPPLHDHIHIPLRILIQSSPRV